MRQPRSLALLLSLFLALPAAASYHEGGEGAEPRIVELGREEPRVMEHLEYLTERIGPRLTGSPNLTRACQWAQARFESFGLRAWLEEWGTFPVGFGRGPSDGGMVAPIHMDYVFTTNAWTAGTPGPVRARAVLAPASADEAEARRDELAGAWVVDLPQDRRPKRAARKEVGEALEAIELAGRVRDAASGELVYAFGNHEIEWEELPTEVQVNLLEAQFEDLVARLDRGEEVELEFDVDNRFLPGPVPLFNVIAEIPGTELPDEYVIVGGHIDSWDPARGAQDNGTGVATTLEAARLLAESGARPRRTIRFHLWGGEEQGLLGSRAYVEAHPDELERISAVLVHDMGTNYLSGIAGPKALVEQLREAFAPAAELDSTMPFEVSENEGLSPRGGSDHVAFLSAGVPGFSWRQSGRTSYRYSWHTQFDTLEFVVPEYLEHSAMVVALGALGIANLDERLDRTDLVRAGREGSRRRMGVFLDGTEVQRVVDDSKAAEAGWQEGDVIVAIDGVEVDSQRDIVSELQKGEPRKVITLQRGEEQLESVLDYTGEASEVARAKAEAESKAAEEAAAEREPAEAGAGRE